MLAELKARISAWEEAALGALSACEDTASLEVFYRENLGRKGSAKELLGALKGLDAEGKREVGPLLQAAKTILEQAFEARQTAIKKAEMDAKLAAEFLDVTEGAKPKIGHLHPLTTVQRKVEDIFLRMGYRVEDGPEIETEWHNFDALNIPESHPARDMQDTFWIRRESDNPKKNRVLRTQTSNVQIRAMQEYGAPLRMICPGRVYRNEATDATHDSIFYQVEGLVIDRDISLSHLKGTVDFALQEIFEKPVKTRYRPGFFPFVEPGLEVDLWWEYTDKDGNEKGRWLEFMGAGMVHPNVLKNGGIDPEKYTGFAFGMGLTRLVMMQYGIEDIRLLFGYNPQFARQF